MGGRQIVRLGLCMAAWSLLTSCTPKAPPPPEIPATSASKCEAIFVLAPTQFMRYMDFSEHPMLASEGREQDLPVFCSSDDARAVRDALVAECRLPYQFWSVYRLEGLWETDVIEVEPGVFRMRHPALLYAKADDNL